MYRNTAIVGNLSGNVLVHHNCNTRQVCDLILLRDQSLLLILGLLHEILLIVGTVCDPITAVGHSDVVGHSLLNRRTLATRESSTSDYIMVVAQTVVVAVVV